MALRQSPLAGIHDDAGASTTEFGGWAMPVTFDSIRTEHAAVREEAGKFDVSHMGQLTVTGPDAVALTQRLTTNDVTALDPGEAQYAAITDEDGIMLDDTVVYRLPAEHPEDLLVIPNAGHDGEMHERWTGHRDEWGMQATVTDSTAECAMVALQGPEAPAVLRPETDIDLTDLGRFEMASGSVGGVDALIARTGYTGERGFELLCDWGDAETLWDALDCQPCGLGARDTLRLEMGFLLSGQDFDPESEPRTPHEAGIDWTVKLDTEFVGRDALEAVEVEGPAERLVGIVLRERGVPRHGYAVETPGGDRLGHVTSGTMSPTLGEPIALAYLPSDYATPGESVRVVVRDEPKKARTRATPFLER